MKGVSRGPALRTQAYLALWSLLALLLYLRRVPEAPVVVEPSPHPVAPFTIDLNHDPWPRLALLEGIGETLARKIVRFREERGGFRSIEEVMEIPGIPDRPFLESRPWLSLGR